MGMIKCSICEAKDSITYCSETSVPLCADCALPCDVCNIPISAQRAQVTSTGRKLCYKCMTDRNARRKAKREKLKTESREKRRAKRVAEDPFQQSAPANIPPGPVSTPPASVSKPVGKSGLASPGVVASPGFHSMIANDPLPSAPTSLEGLGGPQAPGAASLEAGREDDGEGDDGDDFGATPQDDDRDGPKRGYGLEGVPTEKSARLELPSVDDKRPVYVQSGYQSPTVTKYFFAFLFFGVSGIIFYGTTPILHDLLFPFDTPDYEFISNQMTPIQDTNRLRNTSNISQFEILSQAPIFFITWLILIVYVGGSIWLIVSTLRSIVSSYRSKRHLKKAQKKHPGDPYKALERF